MIKSLIRFYLKGRIKFLRIGQAKYNSKEIAVMEEITTKLNKNKKYKYILTWNKILNSKGCDYKFKDQRDKKSDPSWLKPNNIYRWANSNGGTLYIGQTERRLFDRISNYLSACEGSKAGATNKRLYKNFKVSKPYLEYITEIDGFDLRNKKDRLIAEALLIGIYKPEYQYQSPD